MSVDIAPMSQTEAARLAPPAEDAGLGALRTERGNLPLDRVDLRGRITGLVHHTELVQEYRNPHPVPLEATYVFPLPDRAAVTGMRMTAGDRVIEAELQERGAARQAYDQAIAAGQRASIAEEERPDVFTMRVGNILPGERVTVTLSLAGALPYEDDAATYRFPLVVAPRYIPGTPLPEEPVGDGYAPDTDAVPDASRITPAVLLPGFPNPVRLAIEVEVDPAGLPLTGVRSSLHAVSTSEEGGRTRVRVQPGHRLNRDFVLRLTFTGAAGEAADTLVLVPDADGDQGSYLLTLLPPPDRGLRRPRDVVLVLDRSGSMGGWKMVAARRAAARIVDSLTTADRFAVLTFDHQVDRPDQLPAGLAPATDRHRFRAVEHLAKVDARGGTELLAPLRTALALLGTAGADAAVPAGRDPVLVLVTDGQVGNEDQIVGELADQLARVRVHTVGVDQAVNAGFLGRLAVLGGGRCELVESEDRLDQAMDRIHRRIGAPLVTGVRVAADGLELIPDTTAPSRVPDLFPGVPLTLAGRYRGEPAGALVVSGTAADGSPSSRRVAGCRREAPAVTAVWARAHLRDLEDRYAAGAGRGEGAEALLARIVDTSLRFGVLCRFTAYVAVDPRVVTDGSGPHRVVQPVEPAAGWDMLGAGVPAPAPMVMPAAMPPPGMMRPAVSRGRTVMATDAAVHVVPCSRTGGAAAGPVAPEPATAQPAGPPPTAEAAEQARAEREAVPAPKRQATTDRLMRRLTRRGPADPGGADTPTMGGGPVPRTGPEHPELVTARSVAGTELARLVAAAGEPLPRRRELLDDLASRLDALVRHLQARGVPERPVAPLRDLVTRLIAGDGPDADAVERDWAEAVRVLTAFADGR